jgi:hypothetical protein
MPAVLTLTTAAADLDSSLIDFPTLFSPVDDATDSEYSSFWSTIANGGGDARFKDGATELPREVVSCDTTAKTGEFWFLRDYSILSDNVTTIEADGTSSNHPNGGTYGRDAVWVDYAAVLHMDQYDTVVNSTGGANAIANNPTSSADVVAGAVGSALELLDDGDYLSIAVDADYPMAMQAILKKTTAVQQQEDIIGRAGGGQYQSFRVDVNEDTRVLLRNGNGGENVEFAASLTVDDGQWQWHTASLESGDLRIHNNGTQVAASAATHGVNSITSDFIIGAAADSLGREVKGTFDEVRIRSSALSADWITTEYNNQSSPSTFYTASAVSASTTVTPYGSHLISRQFATIAAARLGGVLQ